MKQELEFSLRPIEECSAPCWSIEVLLLRVPLSSTVVKCRVAYTGGPRTEWQNVQHNHQHEKEIIDFAHFQRRENDSFFT